MKTIAISIDDETLRAMEHLERKKKMNRSEVFREAASLYVAREQRLAEEEKERKIFRRHKRKISRQTAALIEEQADL